MKHFLIVVDMQKDFVDGALGTKEAVGIVPAVTEKIRNFDGEIFVTLDTHFENYMETAEGKKLPVPHCIKDTEGWRLDKNVAQSLKDKKYTIVEKKTFGSVELPELIESHEILEQEVDYRRYKDSARCHIQLLRRTSGEEYERQENADVINSRTKRCCGKSLI